MLGCRFPVLVRPVGMSTHNSQYACVHPHPTAGNQPRGIGVLSVELEIPEVTFRAQLTVMFPRRIRFAGTGA